MRRRIETFYAHGESRPARPRKFRRVSKLHGVALSCMILGMASVWVGVQQPRAAQPGSVLGAHTMQNRGKHLRAIKRHAFKRACSIGKKGKGWCMAEYSVDANGKPLTVLPASSGSYGPTEFHTAYNLPCTPGGSVSAICGAPNSFGPETIAIVDAGNFSSGSSGLETSLTDYDQYYGLPSCTIANGCLSVLNQSGASSPLPGDAGWSDEIALDVETAHMVCQTCKIALFEADSSNVASLAAAEVSAAALNPVSISNSWGADSDVTSLDADFDKPGIAIVASNGDSGTVSSGPAWPADNPDVVAAAGTTLQLNTDDSWASETVWDDSGGGCSNYYAVPSWQSSRSDWNTNGCGSFRAFGDVSADGDPSTGAAINLNGTWYEIGGTSLSSPLIAGMYALAGGVASGTTASSVPYASFTGSNSHDITSGSDCTGSNTTHCTAAVGFDTPSGLGSPNGITGFISLPTPPANLKATTASQTELDLSWSPSTATGGINGYHIYRNGTKITTVSGTTYNDTGLTPNTTYSYYVVAYDGSGNLSFASGTAAGYTAFAADINEDGHINLLDLSLLANKYGQSGANLGRANINGDGKVDLLDLSILASNYGSE